MTTNKDIKFKSNDFDITVNQVKFHNTKELNEHYLTLLFNGNDLNIKILNTLRRVCSNYIPVYAYAPELIKIPENTSDAFNNDMMRLDLSLLPVVGIDPGLYELDEKYWYGIDYADIERPIHPNERNIEFYLNKHNNSQDYIRVTTNEARVAVDGEQIQMYDRNLPVLLIELTGNQTFKCHMKAVLGIGENADGGRWKAAANAFYDQKESGEFEFTVYGNNMFSEHELLIRSCKFMISKLTRLKQLMIEKINRKELTPEREMNFILDNEDHTIGEPVNYELQSHPDIIFSGLSKPDLLTKYVIIKAVANANVSSPVKAFLDSIDKVEQKFHKLGFVLQNLNAEEKDSESDSQSESDSSVEEQKQRKPKAKQNRKPGKK